MVDKKRPKLRSWAEMLAQRTAKKLGIDLTSGKIDYEDRSTDTPESLVQTQVGPDMTQPSDPIAPESTSGTSYSPQDVTDKHTGGIGTHVVTGFQSQPSLVGTTTTNGTYSHAVTHSELDTIFEEMVQTYQNAHGETSTPTSPHLPGSFSRRFEKYMASQDTTIPTRPQEKLDFETEIDAAFDAIGRVCGIRYDLRPVKKKEEPVRVFTPNPRAPKEMPKPSQLGKPPALRYLQSSPLSVLIRTEENQNTDIELLTISFGEDAEGFPYFTPQDNEPYNIDDHMGPIDYTVKDIPVPPAPGTFGYNPPHMKPVDKEKEKLPRPEVQMVRRDSGKIDYERRPRTDKSLAALKRAHVRAKGPVTQSYPIVMQPVSEEGKRQAAEIEAERNLPWNVMAREAQEDVREEMPWDKYEAEARAPREEMPWDKYQNTGVTYDTSAPQGSTEAVVARVAPGKRAPSTATYDAERGLFMPFGRPGGTPQQSIEPVEQSTHTATPAPYQSAPSSSISPITSSSLEDITDGSLPSNVVPIHRARDFGYDPKLVD